MSWQIASYNLYSTTKVTHHIFHERLQSQKGRNVLFCVFVSIGSNQEIFEARTEHEVLVYNKSNEFAT